MMSFFGNTKKDSEKQIASVAIYLNSMGFRMTEFGEGVAIALKKSRNTEGEIACRFALFCLAKDIKNDSLLDHATINRIVANIKFSLYQLFKIGDLTENQVNEKIGILGSLSASDVNQSVLGLLLADNVMLQGDIVFRVNNG
ncbi:hypothetical protein [Providencia stuartii]|uniref:hypothetical protein n=1 Tax=Providencia stuartii TaxID=588 RepID=UPI00300CA121